MKNLKQILAIGSISLIIFASKSAFAQGTLSPSDQSLAPDDSASLVSPSDILPIVTPSPAGPDLQMQTFDPTQLPDNGGISQSASFNLSPSPVPEPSSTTLLIVAFFGAAMLRWSRTKRNTRPNQQAGNAVIGLR
jgi:hypothetical protein